MAEIIAQHPDRLLGAAALPMQDPDAAARELQRAVRELGLVAAYVGTDYPFPLDDPCLDDLYRTFVALDVPLFLHPSSTGGAAMPADPRLHRFNLDLIVGYAYDESLAVASLVYGGVLERHPNLDICISHGGGALPFLFGRYEGIARYRDWAPESVRQNGFRNEVRKLWFDAHVEGTGGARPPDQDRRTGPARVRHELRRLGHAERDIDFDASLTPNAEKLLRLGTPR